MDFTLNDEERRALLADARETIAAELENRAPCYGRSGELERAIRGGESALGRLCGAFVTLQKKGNLRGCIGRMRAAGPLEETVRVMAAEAAFHDPRFPPLKRGELEDCDIEVSVLSPMELCPDPGQITVGVHGVYMSYRGSSAVFLPQVPLEQGWDLEEYLDHLCVKAGVPPKSWKMPEASLLTFTAIVFGEKSPGV
ncbi:MAG: AmmeMemoRadiSam system protein A [Treponema sp.]|jgi:AmmeMemoRadiSam system protein A|nr:AmmeMemoRadiSam system protein A [Treponema sp.]